MIYHKRKWGNKIFAIASNIFFLSIIPITRYSEEWITRRSERINFDYLLISLTVGIIIIRALLASFEGKDPVKRAVKLSHKIYKIGDAKIKETDLKKKAQRTVLNAIHTFKYERVERNMELTLEEIKNKIKYLCDTNEIIKTYLNAFNKDWFSLYTSIRKELNQYIL